ncbi:MAG TPA: excisionase family DNA-binding protein [Armatimonadota bacterium]|nr:excisionase family DNA-binding protein [Armatimonadota bacterium]
MGAPEVLTVNPAEASARLGLGRGTVYRLLRCGRLPSVRVGRRPNYRIPVAALEEALKNSDRLTLTEDCEQP